MKCLNCGYECNDNFYQCPRCGYVLNMNNSQNINMQSQSMYNNQQNINYQQNSYYQQNNKNQKNNKHKKKVFIPLCIIFIIVSVFFITEILNIGPDIYINFDNNGLNIDNIDNIDNGSNNNSNSNNVSKTDTVIDSEKTYVKEINSVDDIKKLIRDESLDQRKKCPNYNNKLDVNTESKYDIAGVNFCEIEPDFANEIVKVIDYYYNYPEIKGFLNNYTISSGNSQTSSGVIAFFRQNYFTKCYEK